MSTLFRQIASSLSKRRLFIAVGNISFQRNHIGGLVGGQPFRRCFSSTTTTWDARVSGLDDGSESTLGQDGKYTGSWDSCAARPQGQGKMVWDNGNSPQDGVG